MKFLRKIYVFLLKKFKTNQKKYKKKNANLQFVESSFCSMDQQIKPVIHELVNTLCLLWEADSP